MVRVFTDSEIFNKVSYVFQEFKRIQNFPLEIEVCHLPSSAIENLNWGGFVILYTKRKIDSVDRCLSYRWQNHISLNDYKHIEYGDVEKYDPIWLSFFMLSRLSEFQTEKKAKFVNSYSHRVISPITLRYDKPYVNLIFRSLESWLFKKTMHINSMVSDKAIVEFSHDLDYLYKTPQLRLKQSAFKTFNAFRANNGINDIIIGLTGAVKFCLESSDYWMFDYWSKFEMSNNIRSTFYVYAKDGNSDSPRSWLIDPSYNIAENKNLKDKLKSLNEDGFSIGLHGSLKSAISLDQMKREKKILEESLGFEVTKTRQHWLNYKELKTPYIHEQLFAEDSTIGWNNNIGFRTCIASKYRPYDHLNDCSFKYFIVPQIMMDSHFFDYGNNQTMIEAIRLIDTMKGLKNLHYSISWHPRTAHQDYNWHTTYEELVGRLLK